MIYLTILIFVKEGKEKVFHEFEKLAIPILEDYNGKIIYRIRPTKESYISLSLDEELPYEIHFISFDSGEDFLNFTKDERRKEFMHLREDSIKSTLLIKGEKV